MFTNEPRQALFSYLQTSKEPLRDVPGALHSVEEYVKLVLLKADARYGHWNDDDRYIEAARLIRQLITEHKQTQKQQLIDALRTAEEDGDDAGAAQLRQRLNELIKEIPRAKR